MPPSSWTSWGQKTLTAALGFVGGVVAVVLSFADVRHAANDAKVRVEDHEGRLRSLEATASDMRSLKEKVEEMWSDVKTLLQRTAPK